MLKQLITNTLASVLQRQPVQDDIRVFIEYIEGEFYHDVNVKITPTVEDLTTYIYDCRHDKYIKCPECEEYHFPKDMRLIDGQWICDRQECVSTVIERKSK